MQSDETSVDEAKDAVIRLLANDKERLSMECAHRLAILNEFRNVQDYRGKELAVLERIAKALDRIAERIK